MQDLKALVNEKIAGNRTFREAMLALIASREAIAFVGAGLSSALQYPSWNDLLEKLRVQANHVAPFNPPDAVKADVLQYAEEIKKHFRNNGMLPQFNSAIGHEFMPRSGANCTTTHNRLIKLPFRAFVTTNYDDCLEQALNDFAIQELGKSRLDPGVVIKANKSDRHLVSAFLRSIVDRVEINQRRVGHIHGRYNDTDNIILAASDYENAYGLILKGSQLRDVPALTFHRQLIWSLFATRQLVFCGCSMDDPYIKALLDMVTADLWEWNQPIHFVIMPINENSVSVVDGLTMQLQNYGLQPVFFDNCKGEFSNLDQLLDEAFERCPHDESSISGSASSSNTLSVPHMQKLVSAKEASFKDLVLALFQKIVKVFSRALLFYRPAQPEKRQEQIVGPHWLEEINAATEKSLRHDED